MPIGNTLSVSSPASFPPRSSGSILPASRPRTDLSELKAIDLAWEEGSLDSIDDGWGEVSDGALASRTSGLELRSHRGPLSSDVERGELTPSPVVVCEERPPLAREVETSSVTIAGNEDVVWRGSAIECGIGVWRAPPEDEEDTAEMPLVGGLDGENHPVEYHPPRPPPSAVTPPRLEASFSVASDYDPKAATQPRIPRSSMPANPMLLGLDRMLIWGMLLGGLFVAVIVVIVNQVALTRPRPAAPEEVQREIHASQPAHVSASNQPATLGSAAPTPAGEANGTRAVASGAAPVGAASAREAPAQKAKKVHATEKAQSAPAAPSVFSFDQPILGPDRTLQRLAEPLSPTPPH